MARLNKYIPSGLKFRDIQSKVDDFLIENYDKHRVFVIEMATGSGKSLIAYCLSQFLRDEKKLRIGWNVHRKQLQDQCIRDFPEIEFLKGMSEYRCANNKRGLSCGEVKKIYGKICQPKDDCECTWLRQMKKCGNSSVALYNLHSYFANSQMNTKNALIVDEAHNIINFLTDIYSAKILKNEISYSENIEDVDVAIKWLTATCNKLTLIIGDDEVVRSAPDGLNNPLNLTEDVDLLKERREKYARIKSQLENNRSTYIVQKVKNKYEEYVYFAPKNLKEAGTSILGGAKKIFLLSATLNELDLANLGFDPSEVAIFRDDSPIPAKQRPFKFIPVCNMSRARRDETFPQLISAIKDIMNFHQGQKGIIHCTYETSFKMQQVLTDRRLMFHNKNNAQQMLDQFIKDKRDMVFVACGMEEGLDLKDDLARFQIITQAMYPFLGDPLWAWKMKNAPLEYIWETIRTIIQQSGRIVRSETDSGITYLLDDNGSKLFSEQYIKLWPKWFLAAARNSTLEKALKK